jgi:hypothetical protein
MATDDNADPAASCAFNAVLAGATAEELKRVIDDYASSGGGGGTTRSAAREREQRRLAAVNYAVGGYGGEHRAPVPPLLEQVLRMRHLDDAHASARPLAVALYGLRRDDLVGVLLEAGADAAAALGLGCSALAVAIHCGLAETLRALLRSGKHRVDETLRYDYDGTISGLSPLCGARCHAVHICVSPKRRFFTDDPVPPLRLELLEVLVREFGASVHATDQGGHTPLHWLTTSESPLDERERAVDVLLSLGANIDATCYHRGTVLYEATGTAPELVPHLLSKGASANALVAMGYNPLLRVCYQADGPHAAVNVPLLLAASSRATRRAVCPDRRSALEWLLERHGDSPSPPAWCRDAIDQLLLDRVPINPYIYARRALPHAARLGARLQARAAARKGQSAGWRTHDAMVRLALDFQEVREAEEGVRAREARVAELERALGGGGGEGEKGEESG